MPLVFEFVGDRRSLLLLSLKTACLTIITLGLYRSWMKTRLRRWYWSSISVGGQSLTYTGSGAEKFLGFLVALSFLAFYISFVNVILMYVSISLLNTSWGAYFLAFVGALPVVFYGMYEGRKYLTGRTQWRGIRFGMENGGIAFSILALKHFAIALATLGFLYPLMSFVLTKYQNERTWFGDLRLEQGGDWGMLRAAWWPCHMALVGTVLVLLSGAFLYEVFLYGLWITIPLTIAGWSYYRAERFRLMTNHLSAGKITLKSELNAMVVARRFMIGSTIVYGVLGGATWLVRSSYEGAFDGMAYNELLAFYVDEAAQLAVIASIFLVSAIIYLVWSVLGHLLVRMPMLKAYAESVELYGETSLQQARQRENVRVLGADGFAEALDLGAGI